MMDEVLSFNVISIAYYDLMVQLFPLKSKIRALSTPPSRKILSRGLWLSYSLHYKKFWWCSDSTKSPEIPSDYSFRPSRWFGPLLACAQPRPRRHL